MPFKRVTYPIGMQLMGLNSSFIMFYSVSTVALLSWKHKQTRVFIYFISNKKLVLFHFHRDHIYQETSGADSIPTYQRALV